MLTHGEILQRWREKVLGVSQAEAARRLNISRVQVARMEDGTRSINRAGWAGIDKAFAAGGTLAGLFEAVATPAPNCCQPRTKWSHNFDIPSQPVWMWLRVPDDVPVHAAISWGPVHLNIEHPAVTDGVIVTSPTSVPNPPAEVSSAAPLWVDFGVGVIPEKLGFVVIDGAKAVSAQPWNDEVPAKAKKFYPGVLGNLLALTRRIGLSDRQVVPHLASILPEQSPALRLSRATAPVEPVRMMESKILRGIREARGWSSPALAEAVAARRERTEGTFTGTPITSDTIDAAEEGRKSRVPFLLSRIDIELGLDGRSCLEVVKDVRQRGGQFTITFPAFWVGPIWLVFTNPDPAGVQKVGTVTLTWAPWRRRLDVVHGTVVTTRRSAEDCAPLLVDVPSGWLVGAGVGLPEDAHDVGEGWRPAGAAGMFTLLMSSLAAMRKQFDERKQIDG